MTEHSIMDKPGRSFAKPLRDLLGKVVGDSFTRQGFASAELLYGSRGPDSGVLQFILYGLVGFVPAAVSSAIANRTADRPAGAAQSS